MTDLREVAGFLNTGASFASDLTLTIYLFLLVPGMLLGFYFARRKKYTPHHKLTMTTIVLINWVLIVFVMVVGYRDGVLPFLDSEFAAQFAGDPRIALPIIHGITGGVAQLLATYLVIRMWFENVLPKWVMVTRIKRYMRFTLALWIVTAALGAVIYFSWYVNPLQVRTAQPVVTVEPGSTPEIGGTPELTPAGTAELAPGATVDPHADHFPSPLRTQEVTPVLTPEAMFTPEVAFTPEVDADDILDATEDAFDDAMDATEDALDDAMDATEDAFDDAADATEDALDDAEDAARDQARATERARDDNDN